MRATRTSIAKNRRGRRLQHMSFEQRAELRKRYVANIPPWRQSIIGYILCIPLVALAILASLSLHSVLLHFYFPGTLLELAVLIVAVIWGVGPALLTVALSTLSLDYFIIPSPGQLDLADWQGALQLLPFVVAGLTITIITAQRERARLDALAAEQEAQSYAQELETINQKLEDADQMKDRFLSIASHELKTPITTIRGQAQLMLRRLSKQKQPDMESLRTTLERIEEQTTRLTSLVNELLDVSRIRTGKMELRKRQCALEDLCREVVEDQRLLTGRTIRLRVPDTSVKMHVDSDRLSQVVVNLVSNAVKYSPDDGPVDVCLDQRDHAVLIRVRDRGKGIALDQQSHIFETFYRTPDAESSSQQGLGLGLAISRDIVERHGGRIWCESQPDQGSTFIVELPLR